MKKFIGLFASTIILPGCASLTVDVAIIEREHIDSMIAADRIKQAMPFIRSEQTGDIERQVLDIQNAHFDLYSGTAEDLEAEAHELESAANGNAEQQAAARDLRQIANSLENEFNEAWTVPYTEFQEDWNNINAKIVDVADALAEVTDVTERERLTNLTEMRLEERNLVIGNFFKRVEEDADCKLAGESISVTANQLCVTLKNHIDLVSNFRERADQLFKQQGKVELFHSGEIEHSKYASIVAGAPEEFWIDDFDYATGSGFWGNVDVAIKALGPTNFTIKGLSFNPSDVAIAAAKASTQALLIASQIAGVPVAIEGTPSGTGSALATSSDRLKEQTAALGASQARLNDYDTALSVLASTIITEVSNLSSDDTLLIQESLGVIHGVYASQQARLTNLQPSED